MAAFRTASRLFPGLHSPFLGMGLEYARMNNLPLAEQMLRAAHERCPADPAVAHELGTLAYRSGRYQEAVAWLQSALDASGHAAPAPSLEATLVNLGHALRKLCRWDEAIEAFTKALGTNSLAPGTYAALGYTHHLKGNVAIAIEHYHKCLGLRSEDTFVANMLSIAVDEENQAALAELGVHAN
jgi:anaphase-promoting complex subunit 6